MGRLTWMMMCMTVAVAIVHAQTVSLDGYTFEKYNRGFLNEVKITVLDESKTLVGEAVTDETGHFVLPVPIGKTYYVSAEKRVFVTRTDTVATRGSKNGEAIYMKLEMERQPGYLLDAKIANKRVSNTIPIDAIQDARIEIYNNTTKKTEFVSEKHGSPFFTFTLQQGNHYTLLIRRAGYFNKRMEARVNVDGCILCFEGVGTVTPGISDNLSSIEDRKVGTLVANIEMEQIDTSRNMVIQNIYYEFGSAALNEVAKAELDKIAGMLKNNPHLVVELGSHTDSRGSAESNRELSEQRAKFAVDYIVNKINISRERIRAKGYGESRLVNECEDGTPCNDEKHRQNRRTELRITGFTLDRYRDMSLAEIIHEEELERFITSSETFQSVEYKGSAQPIASTEATASVSLESKGSKVASQEAKVKEAVVADSLPKNTPPLADGEKKNVKDKKVEKKVKENTKTTKTERKTSDTKHAEVKSKPTGEKVGKPADDFDEGVTKPVSVTQKPTGTIPEMTRNAPAPASNGVKVTDKPAEVAKTAEPAKKPEVVYAVFPVQADYSGYKVMFLTSNTELKKQDERLRSAAELMTALYFYKANNEYYYMLGDFQHWGETERVLTKVKETFPNAEIVEFFKGKKL